MKHESPAAPLNGVLSLPSAQVPLSASTSSPGRSLVSVVATDTALLSTALSAAPVGAAITTPDLDLLEVNQPLCNLLGYPPDALVGRSLRDFREPGDSSSSPSGPSRANGNARPGFEETQRFRHRDGHVIRARLTGSVLPAQVDGSDALIVYVQDLGPHDVATEDLFATAFPTRRMRGRVTDGYVVLDREWHITYFDEAAARALRRPRRDLLGSSIWDAYPAAVGTPFYTACHSAARDGVPVSVQNYYPPTRSWFDLHIFPSGDGLSVFFTDITEAKQREQQLRTSEAKHRFLLDHVPAVIYALANDAEQTRLYFSPGFEELTGYTLAETLANRGPWLDLVHPEDRPRVAAENARSHAADDRFRAEYRLRRKDGAYVWVHDECVPVRDDTGEVVTWQGVLLDITDRVAAQAAQNHLAALVISAEDAIISSDLDGLITSWNPGATRLYGYEPDEILGRPFAWLLPGSVDHDVLDGRIRSARSGETVEVFETQRRRKDGSLADVAITMSPIRDENGKVVGVSTITRDVTERNRVERALRDALESAETAARTVSMFLAMMSHELRTPVQAVLGYAELLLLDPDVRLTPEHRADVVCIQDGARRLDRLIKQLLILSRLEAGRLALEIRVVDLAAVVDDVRKIISPQADAKHLSLEIDVPATLSPGLGDPESLRQIVLNLAENAVKFTDEGSISIRAREIGERVAIEVADTGIGISPDVLPTIFEEFRQVDANLTRRYGGAGLGLAVAERLAAQMNGNLRVTSEPGRGSTFVLDLPRAPVSTRVSAPAATVVLAPREMP